MFPNDFDYVSVDTVDEAIEYLQRHDDAELLAGGHSLLPTIKSGLATPSAVVDISDIDDLVGVSEDGDSARIGALTRYVDLLESPPNSRYDPILEAIEQIGDVQVRNRGTIGGNLAHADPGADLPGAMIAADATIHVTGPEGDRSIHVDDFFLAMYTTALETDEIITDVEIPALSETDAGTYLKKESPSSGYAMIGVGVRLRTDGSTIQDARVGANGALPYATRLEAVESILVDAEIDAEGLAERAGSNATEDFETWEFMDDIQASAEFRSHLLEVYVQRAIEETFDRIDS